MWNMRVQIGIAVVVGVTLLLTGTASAGESVIAGSTFIDPPPYDANAFWATNSSISRAFPFHTAWGYGGGWCPKTLKVPLDYYYGNGNPGDHATFSIYSDNGGVPGVSLADFQVSGIPLSAGTPRMCSGLADTRIQLDDDENYWLVGSTSSGGQVNWYLDPNAHGQAAYQVSGGGWVSLSSASISSYAITGSRVPPPPPRPFRYPDANKTDGNVDGNLCWAAATANILKYHGWAQGDFPAPELGRDPDEQQILAYYGEKWGNIGNPRTDEGDLKWFIHGLPGVAGGGFYRDCGVPEAIYYSCDFDMAEAMYHLNRRRALYMDIVLEGNQILGIEPGAHVITCYEYRFDRNGDLYLKCVDSDDVLPGEKWIRTYEQNGHTYLEYPPVDLLGVHIPEFDYYVNAIMTMDLKSGVEMLNDRFLSGDLLGWSVQGEGSVQVIEDAEDEWNLVAELTAGSPVAITQSISTPGEACYLCFDYLFGSTDGVLEVSLEGQFLDSIAAPATTMDGMLFHTIYFDFPELMGLPSAELRFWYDGPTGSTVQLDNIIFLGALADVPEPSTMALLASATLALGLRTRIRLRPVRPVQKRCHTKKSMIEA